MNKPPPPPHTHTPLHRLVYPDTFSCQIFRFNASFSRITLCSYTTAFTHSLLVIMASKSWNIQTPRKLSSLSKVELVSRSQPVLFRSAFTAFTVVVKAQRRKTGWLRETKVEWKRLPSTLLRLDNFLHAHPHTSSQQTEYCNELMQ